jgi:hypothetical protein
MGTVKAIPKDQVDLTLPALEDHAEYASCANRVIELRKKLAEAETEVSNFAGQPSKAEADSFAEDDIDVAVAKSEEIIESHARAKRKAETRRDAVRRALDAEESRVAELHRLSVEQVGRAASEKHARIEAEVLLLRERLSTLYCQATKIRQVLIAEINRPDVPGYLTFSPGERFVRAIAAPSGGY